MPSYTHSAGDGSGGGFSELPEPPAAACAHSKRLSEQLELRLAEGSMSFADYMQFVLYAPGLGYYMAGAHKFGAAGDFITAPEVSPLFGTCIAAQCREVLELTGGHILELGAGSGQLAVSVLTALQNVPGLQYYILEPSAELQRRQQTLIATQLGPDIASRVSWIVSLPDHFSGLVLANEVMDALPVERFTITDRLWQVGVVHEHKGLRDSLLASPAALTDAVGQIEKDVGYCLPSGYASEVNLLLSPWIASLADCLSTGVLLLADYGYPRHEYYLAERGSGTLACYFQHRMHADPYRYPGLQDITAHVDFTRVAESGLDAGLELLGYTSQASFLLALDLVSHADKAMSAAPQEAQRLAIAQAVKTLTLPGEMGERFQFMALGKGVDCALRGFCAQDLSHRL